MKKLAAAAAFLLTAACASTSSDGDLTPDYVPPAQQANDTRVAELQTSLTELLERLDVLNDRIARLESAPVPSSSAAAAAPAPEILAPAPRRVAIPAAEPAAAQPDAQPQRALVGAKVAESYRNALMLYGKNRVADSRRAFQDVFDSDPTGEL